MICVDRTSLQTSTTHRREVSKMKKFIEIVPGVFMNREQVMGWAAQVGDKETKIVMINKSDITVALTPQEVWEKIEGETNE